MLLPPPNVTGRLHMGHMLNHTEMDIIVRWHRMRGFLTMWLPGTDHAGIATQMMVERQLASEKKSRLGMGRTAFIERVWQWKQHYGGSIVEQMKRIGDSVDWGREYFTMDDNLSRAVREAFVRLYEEGLLYRGNYIVNWCPRCATAISDLEVVHEETQGKLYDLKYPVIGTSGGTSDFIVVSTTRPETMLGDTAVAVNENDERYRHLHGAKILLPLMNREIPVILDELANPEFGTGAVKVTMSSSGRRGLPPARPEAMQALMNLPSSPSREDRLATAIAAVKAIGSPGFRATDDELAASLGRSIDRTPFDPPAAARQMAAIVAAPPRHDRLRTLTIRRSLSTALTILSFPPRTARIRRKASPARSFWSSRAPATTSARR